MIAFYIPENALNSSTGDAIKITNYSLFAFLNGYLQTHCCVMAPKKVTAEHKEKVGMAVTLILNIGILLGSIVQLIFHSKIYKSE